MSVEVEGVSPAGKETLMEPGLEPQQPVNVTPSCVRIIMGKGKGCEAHGIEHHAQ